MNVSAISITTQQNSVRKMQNNRSKQTYENQSDVNFKGGKHYNFGGSYQKSSMVRNALCGLIALLALFKLSNVVSNATNADKCEVTSLVTNKTYNDPKAYVDSFGLNDEDKSKLYNIINLAYAQASQNTKDTTDYKNSYNETLTYENVNSMMKEQYKKFETSINDYIDNNKEASLQDAKTSLLYALKYQLALPENQGLFPNQ